MVEDLFSKRKSKAPIWQHQLVIKELVVCSLSPAALHLAAPSCSVSPTDCIKLPDIFQTDPLSTNVYKKKLFCRHIYDKRTKHTKLIALSTVPLISDIVVPSQTAQFYRNSSKKWLYLRAKSICHSEAVDAPLFFGLPGILLSPAILSCISLWLTNIIRQILIISFREIRFYPEMPQ